MKILALEFSTPRRSVAVWSDGSVRGRAEITEGRPTPALALIDHALREARLEREQIDRVAVGLGPGSYTGIRIAIALAQGWQLARNVSLLGISSADCIVAQARAAGWQGQLNLLIDAHAHQFYRATYEIAATGWRQTEPFRLLTPAEWPKHAQMEQIWVESPTSGWRSAREHALGPDAAVLAELAAGRSDFVPGEALEPIYLRETTFLKAPPPRPMDQADRG